MASVVESVARTPPSTFAALLRRSKFSTYDPQIGQVYTTYGGHAARGDWGLKRPLSLRRRDGRAVIRSIDTLYQQTEWTSAHSDTVWIKKFEEMGITPKPAEGSAWAMRLPRDRRWLCDSDYTRNAAAMEAWAERMYTIPETRSMSEKRFERYLRKIRRMKESYPEFVRERDEQRTSAASNVGVASLGSGTIGASSASSTAGAVKRHRAIFPSSEDHRLFISMQYKKQFVEPKSTRIRGLPHPSGGLTYAKINDLQRAMHTKPIPGRRLGVLGKKDTHAVQIVDINVAAAGWMGTETRKRGDKLTTVDLGTSDGLARTDKTQGIGIFKPLTCELNNPPDVVGKTPGRITSASLRLIFMDWEKASNAFSNPHKFGTTRYMVHSAAGKRGPFIPLLRYAVNTEEKKKVASPETQQTLVSAIGRYLSIHTNTTRGTGGFDESNQ